MMLMLLKQNVPWLLRKLQLLLFPPRSFLILELFTLARHFFKMKRGIEKSKLTDANSGSIAKTFHCNYAFDLYYVSGVAG